MPKIDRPADDAAPEAWLVYADALQAEDDPLGALIVLNHGVANGEAPARRDAHLAQHAAAILGPLAPHLASIDIAWRFAVPEVVSVRVGPHDDAEALVSALFASPLAAAMRRLRLVGLTPADSDTVHLSDGVRAIAQQLPPSCPAVELVDERARNARIIVSSEYSPGQNLVSFGPLAELLAVPHLRELRIHTADAEQLELAAGDAPGIESFTLLPLRWPTEYQGSSQLTRSLAEMRWPSLRELALRLPETFTYAWPIQDGAYVVDDRYLEENDEYDGDESGYSDTDWPAELGPLLAALQDSGLERLSLTGFASSRGVLQAIAAAGLPARLKHLDLGGSNVDGEDVAWMLEAAHRPLFAALETLDLRGTLVRDPAPLAGLGPEVLHQPGVGSIYEFSVGME